MTVNIGAWRILVAEIANAGIAIAGNAKLEVTEKGYSDPQLLALLILARTLSNLRGAVILLDDKRIVEARTMARCCFENLFWIGSISEVGDDFIAAMHEDEVVSRLKRGDRLLNEQPEMDSQVRQKLIRRLKEMRNQWGADPEGAPKKKLNPMEVAKSSGVTEAYHFYSQLSADSAHPSLDSLHRYLVPFSQPGAGVDFEPAVTDAEIEETLTYLGLAALGVCQVTSAIMDSEKQSVHALIVRYNELITAGDAKAG